MKNVVNVASFQVVWFVAVLRAVRGDVWSGVLAAGVFLVVHLAMVDRGERRRQLAFALGVGVAGALLDSGLRALGATAYPTSSAWTAPTAPPWIAALWIAFALLPRFSLAWLVDRPLLGAGCGAVGGPLSYAAGARLGATAVGDARWTYGLLAVEYALAVPWMLRVAKRVSR